MTELGDFEKVIVPKRQRSCKKSSDGVTGKWVGWVGGGVLELKRDATKVKASERPSMNMKHETVADMMIIYVKCIT